MQVRQVDPRDTQWEVPQPVYRVYFWERQMPQRPDSGWASDEWQLEDADINEVVDWARDNAAGRRFVVYAKVIGGQPDGPGLIRLLGTDPLNE
jgi:hypothetical protein